MGYIAIVDYDVGNLKSISNAMAYLGLETRVAREAGELERADAIILPGVGAFPDAAKKLRNTGLDQTLLAQAERKPVLGICLGMQLLFDWGEEGSRCQGLGLIPGHVEKIQTSHKLPHIGWNTLSFPRKSPLFQGLEQGSAVYFVHSYAVQVSREEDLLAYTDYGTQVTAAVGRGNVYGCQFHPEKSGEVGLTILKNFGELNQ